MVTNEPLVNDIIFVLCLATIYVTVPVKTCLVCKSMRFEKKRNLKEIGEIMCVTEKTLHTFNQAITQERKS